MRFGVSNLCDTRDTLNGKIPRQQLARLLRQACILDEKYPKTAQRYCRLCSRHPEVSLFINRMLTLYFFRGPEQAYTLRIPLSLQSLRILFLATLFRLQAQFSSLRLLKPLAKNMSETTLLGEHVGLVVLINSYKGNALRDSDAEGFEGCDFIRIVRYQAHLAQPKV